MKSSVYLGLGVIAVLALRNAAEAGGQTPQLGYRRAIPAYPTAPMRRQGSPGYAAVNSYQQGPAYRAAYGAVPTYRARPVRAQTQFAPVAQRGQYARQTQYSSQYPSQRQIAVSAAPEVSKGATGTSVANISNEKPGRLVGQESYAEVDLQAGMFSGVRAKGFIYSGRNYNIALEAMGGASLFAESLFPTTYGFGARGEYYLWTKKRSTWMIAPGADLYYIPAVASRPANPAADVAGQFVQSIFNNMSRVSTAVLVASPSVDFNWLYQWNPHLGFVAGVKAGASICLSGASGNGTSLMGKTLPDVGLYLGTRF